MTLMRTSGKLVIRTFIFQIQRYKILSKIQDTIQYNRAGKPIVHRLDNRSFEIKKID